MAILRTHLPQEHDIHLYAPQASRVPALDGLPVGYAEGCIGASVDWSGVSIRPRRFGLQAPLTTVSDWQSPFDIDSINFWNQGNPAAVLVTPMHALICQHFRGTHDRPVEHYRWLGRSGEYHTRRVVGVTLSIGSDHTLLELDEALPREDVAIYDHIADHARIPAGTRIWNHDSNGKAYQTSFVKAYGSSFTFAPVLDGVSDGIRKNGMPGIFAGDSGSPAFVLDSRGNTVLLGLMFGGMAVPAAELAAINAKVAHHGHHVRHVAVGAAKADLNADGVVDGTDLGIAFAAWGNGDPFIDMNGDGIVDGSDLGAVLAAWGPCDPNGGAGSQ